MTLFGFFLRSILTLSALSGIAPQTYRVAAEKSPLATPSRTFEFTYEVRAPANPASPASTHVWIPLPQDDGYQDIRDLAIASAAAHIQGRDPEYGNAFAMFTPTAEQIAQGYEITLRFTATRREHLVRLTGSHPSGQPDPMLKRYLQPDRLVPLNDTIAQLAEEHTIGATTPLDKARRIYEYVVSTMRYDKTGEGWGRGDAVWACSSKRGNCTDFHSLFIGMLRASKIPARFEIGFPLPEGKSEGDIPGYHCWAEFYIDGIGWIPVDASEAWKNAAKHDYFFGAHDDNRIFFTYGRDIRLSPEQVGEPLNYFIYPYAEADGKPVKYLRTRFAFRDITVTAQVSSGR